MSGRKKVTAYTDGACLGNPGPGGYGVVLLYGGHRRELSRGLADTTNNRMELLAAIEALSALKEPCDVELYTDSRYVRDAIEAGWIKGWQKNGWKTASKQPVKNQDLWRQLLPLLDRHKVVLHWIRGHSGHPENERCDVLAKAAASGPGLAPDHRDP